MRERKRKHDDAHFPMSGRGKRTTNRKHRSISELCAHPISTVTAQGEFCCYCKEETGAKT